jgi:hypothetical protein
MGSVIIFLFVLSLFVLSGRIKVWLLSCTIFSIVLSWGSNFELVTDFFFYYFPMFNKFRTPSMMLTVACLTIPLMAVMGLNKILQSTKGIQSYMPEIKKSFYIVGGTCLFFALMGSSLFSFSGANDGQLPEGWPIESLSEDRKDLLTFGALKALMFVSAGFALLLAFAKSKLSPRFFMIGMGLVIVADIWMADKTYLNEDNMVKRRSADDFYVDNANDKLILQDTDPNFRVFNIASNPFNDAFTSFHHKSVGGYHGAKLIRYQDMIDHHLSKNNTKVLDMLNTRYYIVPNKKTGQKEVKRNPGSLGNSWFVNNIIWAENADEEIASLNSFDPAKDVVIDKRFREQFKIDSELNSANSTIELLTYQPNKLTYKTNVSAGSQFAVFSEIYYEGTDHDWKVTIDGQSAKHIRVNYILRGMEIPEGEHEVVFSFEPESYFIGEKISLIFSIVVVLYLLTAVFLELKNKSETGGVTQVSN